MCHLVFNSKKFCFI